MKKINLELAVKLLLVGLIVLSASVLLIDVFKNGSNML